MQKNESYIEIKTKRLTLRPFNVNDSKAASYNSQRPRVATSMSDMVLPDEISARKWIEWINEKSNTTKSLKVLAIEQEVDKLCIGLIGIAPKSELNNEVEILFAIADEYQKNGYATEAGKAIISWAFKNCNIDYLVAIVKLDNIASGRVIEKLGFKRIEQRTIEYDGKPTLFNYFRLYR